MLVCLLVSSTQCVLDYSLVSSKRGEDLCVCVCVCVDETNKHTHTSTNVPRVLVFANTKTRVFVCVNQGAQVCARTRVCVRESMC